MLEGVPFIYINASPRGRLKVKNDRSEEFRTKATHTERIREEGDSKLGSNDVG